MTYEYAIEEKKYKIPLIKKDRRTGEEYEDGKMWFNDTLIATRHIESGDLTIFKLYFHQGVWKWGDSRKSGSIPVSDIELELARMLFAGDRQMAADLMEEAYELATYGLQQRQKRRLEREAAEDRELLRQLEG